jgi:hypothetical protein
VKDEFRVEVELDDEAHGYSLGERLRSLDLDDEARHRLGGRVMVTRDGSRLFLYAAAEEQAREAAETVRRLAEEDELTADISITRWHPIEQAWKDVSVPLPRSPEEEQAEYAAREAAELREAELEGAFDWHVVVEVREREDAAELASRLAAERLFGMPTEERAQELADRLRGELADAEVTVEVNTADIELPAFQFLPF